ncbi:MAG: hypothetical protein A2Z83_03740 [Omnitrophica bacterium GWA2_52_8]|nr:MAG: hypothetical protein A2Z83_03740 [Omnitrophica bacterium GWA2_52_8]
MISRRGIVSKISETGKPKTVSAAEPSDLFRGPLQGLTSLIDQGSMMPFMKNLLAVMDQKRPLSKFRARPRRPT